MPLCERKKMEILIISRETLKSVMSKAIHSYQLGLEISNTGQVSTNQNNSVSPNSIFKMSTLLTEFMDEDELLGYLEECLVELEKLDDEIHNTKYLSDAQNEIEYIIELVD